MLGWIALAVEKAAELTAKTVVEAVELPMKVGEAIWDGIEKGTEKDKEGKR